MQDLRIRIVHYIHDQLFYTSKNRVKTITYETTYRIKKCL
nr:MAG TPA: hypothetical protein [Caudoviricetes sp.]